MQKHGAGLLRAHPGRNLLGPGSGSLREGDVAQVLEREEPFIGIDGASVVAVRKQVRRMGLEVEVRRRGDGVAGVTDEAQHRTRLHAQPVYGQRRIGREMRVVESVAVLVAQPEAIATQGVPADREHRSVCDREYRRAHRSEDVDSVVPAGIRSRRSKRIRKKGLPVNRKDVAFAGDLELQVGGNRLHLGVLGLVLLVGSRRRARARAGVVAVGTGRWRGP